MTTMVTEVYDALRDAGASEEKARRAAEVLANYDDRFNRVEARIDRVQTSLEMQIAAVKTDLELRIAAVRTDLERQIAAVKADVAVLKWMTGTAIALIVAVLIKLFVH